MAFQDKKFLDAEGITHLVRLLDEYPNNQVLGSVIDAIEGELEEKADKSEIPVESGTGVGSVQTKSFEYNGIRNQIASGVASFTEGIQTVAQGIAAHAEGGSNKALGNYSHAEGSSNMAYGLYAHVEGMDSHAYGHGSHSEGSSTIAYGLISHVEGSSGNGNALYLTSTANTKLYEYTVADGITWTPTSDIVIFANDTISPVTNVDTTNQTITVSRTLGTLNNQQVRFYFGGAFGDYSHAEGQGTYANSNMQHAQGKWNIQDKANIYADIVGNGEFGSRSNAYALSWTGDGHYAGDVYVHSNIDSSGGERLAKESELGLKVVRLI